MKKSLLLVAFLFVGIFAFGQNAIADVRVSISEVNCETMKLYADIEVRSSVAGTTFHISDQNYRFSFNRAALENPVFDQELVISGTPTGNPLEGIYDAHTTTGSVDTIMSINIELVFGDGYEVTHEWVGVSRIEFDIVDVTECFDIWVHDDNVFPSTFIGEKDPATNTLYQASLGTTYDAVECLVTYCPQCEVDVFEPNNTDAAAYNLGSQQIFGDAYICDADDEDWYKRVVPKNATSMKVFLLCLPADYDLELYNTSGTLIEGSYNMNQTAELITYDISGISAGSSIYIRVFGKNGATSPDNGYCLITKLKKKKFNFNIIGLEAPGDNGFESDEIELMGRLDNFTDAEIYPNPLSSSQKLTMDYYSLFDNNAEIQLMDMNGRLIKKYGVELNEGNNQLNIDVNGLNSGVYILRLLSNDQEQSFRLEVLD